MTMELMIKLSDLVFAFSAIRGDMTNRLAQ
jgi:hypothetical protein